VSLVEFLVYLAIIATLLTRLRPAIQSVRAGMARSKLAGPLKRGRSSFQALAQEGVLKYTF